MQERNRIPLPCVRTISPETRFRRYGEAGRFYLRKYRIEDLLRYFLGHLQSAISIIVSIVVVDISVSIDIAHIVLILGVRGIGNPVPV